jgi:hypothetical protein
VGPDMEIELFLLAPEEDQALTEHDKNVTG